MKSCIYQGLVRHERHRPIAHRFQYRVWMVYVDLDELTELRQNYSFFASNQLAPFSFLRKDHLGDPDKPLDDWVRDQVYSETGLQIHGPVRLLTQLRQWGQYFSPLNLYYCWDEEDSELVAVLAEVSNIPWGEKHVYCLRLDNPQISTVPRQFETKKAFHVSPFMGMNQTYSWNLPEPQDHLHVSIESKEDNSPLFRAQLEMKRTELSSKALAWQMIRQPFPALQIVAAIYYQALRLWWKKCPVYPHPNNPSTPPRQRA